jgi:hypothetical protein
MHNKCCVIPITLGISRCASGSTAMWVGTDAAAKSAVLININAHITIETTQAPARGSKRTEGVCGTGLSSRCADHSATLVAEIYLPVDDTIRCVVEVECWCLSIQPPNRDYAAKGE